MRNEVVERQSQTEGRQSVGWLDKVDVPLDEDVVERAQGSRSNEMWQPVEQQEALKCERVVCDHAAAWCGYPVRHAQESRQRRHTIGTLRTRCPASDS